MACSYHNILKLGVFMMHIMKLPFEENWSESLLRFLLESWCWMCRDIRIIDCISLSFLFQYSPIQVDIYESRSFIGGKVGSFVDKRGNHIEMGLHVFFGCYNNLFRLMKKVKNFYLQPKCKSLFSCILPPYFWANLYYWLSCSVHFYHINL